MASREMGIAQSDQYDEVYERFMKEYDAGKPVADITSDILEDSRAEFGARSGILHGVWFALAKCQWMCGGVSEPVLAEVTRIIRSSYACRWNPWLKEFSICWAANAETGYVDFETRRQRAFGFSSLTSCPILL